MTHLSGTVADRHDLAHTSFDTLLHIEPRGKHDRTQMSTYVRNPAVVDMERNKKPFWGQGSRGHSADGRMEEI